jgi:3-oxoacyl-[acyl-carrier protein] reductase
MDLLLKNKKILITGGSKGIGLACARALAEEGASIIISSRSGENLDAALRLFSGHSAEVHVFPADVSSADEVDALCRFVTDRFGYVDGLVINSGGPPLGPALGHSDEAWLSAFNSLVMPAVRLTRFFVPIMRERRFGRIISISSTGVKQPIDGLVLSNSIRQSVIGFLKTLSSEVAADNILINSILPGSTNTGRLASLHETLAKKSGRSIEEVIASRESAIPAGHFGEPEDLASLAAFLLSGKNNYITGQSIAVDGGMILFPL